MDRQLIEEKLESLRRCVLRASEKCPATPAELAADFDLQDIVALNLSRAVQRSVDIAVHLSAELDAPPPETMGKSFDALQEKGIISATLADNLKKSVGFRNVAVHEYEKINWAIVHAIVRNNLKDFIELAKIVSARIGELPIQ